MKNLLSTIAIIPARGGSKGIPRKNLRPLVGKPMIYYSIKACLSSPSIDKVVVTTDDDEIALLSERFGAEVHMRPLSLATDNIPLDPVILDCLEYIECKSHLYFENIVTVQPTSPLIESHEIEQVVHHLNEGVFDTVQTVVDDRHLCWTKDESGHARPVYSERVNRQLLPSNFRETGAVIACTRKQISLGTRIGKKVGLIEVDKNKSFDIDDFSDLYLCEAMLSRKKIVITVVGYSEVGLGHAFRGVLLAHELVNYDIVFVCEERSDLAIEYIRKFNYKVIACKNDKMLDAVKIQKPDLVINDILDTEKAYIEELKNEGFKVVNFEDLGPGHESADLVVNALYPEDSVFPHVRTGEQYFCVRDEFLYIDKPKKLNKSVKNILLTFGGVDENNLTVKVLEVISDLCRRSNITINIVLGPGYKNNSALEATLNEMHTDHVFVFQDTKRISDFMFEADIAITSGGRTVLELASLKTPTIVICQNQRETTHTFASARNGVLNLGLFKSVSRELILSSVESLISKPESRFEMSEKMDNLDLSKGKERVINEIRALL